MVNAMKISRNNNIAIKRVPIVNKVLDKRLYIYLSR